MVTFWTVNKIVNKAVPANICTTKLVLGGTPVLMLSWKDRGRIGLWYDFLPVKVVLFHLTKQ